jgi:hypothetical protein
VIGVVWRPASQRGKKEDGSKASTAECAATRYSLQLGAPRLEIFQFFNFSCLSFILFLFCNSWSCSLKDLGRSSNPRAAISSSGMLQSRVQTRRRNRELLVHYWLLEERHLAHEGVYEIFLFVNSTRNVDIHVSLFYDVKQLGFSSWRMPRASGNDIPWSKKALHTEYFLFDQLD